MCEFGGSSEDLMITAFAIFSYHHKTWINFKTHHSFQTYIFPEIVKSCLFMHFFHM